MTYGDEKDFQGRRDRGMKVGGPHRWTYPDGQWTERKVSPQRWDIGFTSLKRRHTTTTEGWGAEVGSGSHWLIVAHQWAGKLDADTYATRMEGTKHLVAFRKPGWPGWSTQQRGHTSARLRTIMALEEVLAELREMDDGDFEDPSDDGPAGPAGGGRPDACRGRTEGRDGGGPARPGDEPTAPGQAGDGPPTPRQERGALAAGAGASPRGRGHANATAAPPMSTVPGR